MLLVVSATSGDDPFVADPVGEPVPPARASGGAPAFIMALLAWALVGAIELVDLPNVSVGVLIVPVVEVAVWVTAIGITAYCASRPRRVGAALSVLATLICGLVFVYFTNWSLVEPRSYYVIHRWGFAEVAEVVQQGELGRPGEGYYGQQLPRSLADLSTNGRAATVGRQDGKPVVFLPQLMGIPDDAVGFVYFYGQPDRDLLIDLFGYPAYLAEGESLGDGWWYVR